MTGLIKYWRNYFGAGDLTTSFLKSQSFKWYLCIFPLTLTWISCNNEEALDCFKTTGKIIEMDIPAESFQRIEVHDGMDIYLENAPEEKVIIKGGENLFPKVKIEIEGGLLKIDNENTCNWTRNYDAIEIYVSAPEITEIIHYGFGNIISLDTLRAEKMKVAGRESSGDFNLIVDTQVFVFVSNGLSIANISGETESLYVGHHFNDGIFDAKDLFARFVTVRHEGYNLIRVRAEKSITGVILLNGTLEYYSTDATVDVEILAQGQLIHMGS